MLVRRARAGTALISVMVPGDTARAETWVLLPGHTAISDVGGSHVADIPWAVEGKSLILG